MNVYNIINGPLLAKDATTIFFVRGGAGLNLSEHIIYVWF